MHRWILVTSAVLWMGCGGSGALGPTGGSGPLGGGSFSVGGSTVGGGSGAGDGGSLASTGGSAPGQGGTTASGGLGSGGLPTGGAPAGGTTSTGGALTGSGGVGTGTGGAGGSESTTAVEWTNRLSLGWNLGNSLDVPEGETAWGNPTITSALLSAVKSAGFSAVRIPVTWSKHMGAGPAFTIDATFLARVAEVVGYAHAAGLPAIINLHHDGADNLDGVEWLTLTDAAGNVSAEVNAAVEARFVAVWKQLATYFREQDSDLVFESMNEIHDGYDAPDPAYYEIINHLNQVFVDTVRGTGGKNAERCLVVPGYNTNIDYTLAGFQLPTDPAPNRLILSVHFYDPWSYAGEGSTHTWGAASPGTDSWGQEDYVRSQYDKLAEKFVSKGVPVIVGEYGAVHQTGYEDYRRYYMEYVTKVMVDRGLVPFYWDNGGAGSGADAFGLVKRTDGSNLHPEVLSAMIKAATTSYELSAVPLPSP